MFSKSEARLCALLVFLSVAPTAVSQTAPRKLTPEELIATRTIRELQWSPDGSRLAFTVSEPPQGSGRVKHIWIYETGTGKVRQFTFSEKSEEHPRWSPDGRTLAFLSDREETKHIFLIPADGGEAHVLTTGKRAIQAFEWSPDGKSVAFLAAEPKSDADEKKEKDKDDARVVDREDKRIHLWLAEVPSGKIREITGSPWQFEELQWFPAGDSLLVSATDHPESDQETNRIFKVNVADGKMQLMAAPKGPYGSIRIAPDGKSVSYIGCREDGPAPHDLYLLVLDGGQPRNLTAKTLDRPVERFQWQPGGGWLAITSEGFRHRLQTIDAEGKARVLLSPPGSVWDAQASKSDAIAFVSENFTQPEELWLWDGKNNPRRVSDLNEAVAKLPLAAPDFMHYQTFDGRRIEGALLKPKAYDGKSRLATVLLIHGGPTGNWTDHFDPWGQLLVSAGYAVFYPNVRGSTGYGYDFMVLNRADWGGGDFKDVMAAADDLVARGIADADRLGIAGWSYGGYMAEWTITQTNRFKAAVSGAGMADLAAEFGTEEHPSYDEWFYGLPYEKPEGFVRSSPITHIRNAKTPTLILQGEADTIDPLGQSQQLYRALKRYNVPVELVQYPREGHGLKEEKHLADRLRRIDEWFEKYMKP
jgi:dipeptidyl aminopeptidase/acylaminoacyl peptidase